ncbi:MAG TPA: SRPBCC family protein [Longimicrobium sp.]|nr:SRPBCC family protein [Longimicrobium sp.]
MTSEQGTIDPTAAGASTADREIVLTRVFDARPELVFQAWTDPRHLPHWWGPDGFTITLHECEVRVGGTCRFTMHGPDGTDYPNRIVYREIVRPERLVYDHGDDVDDDPNMFLVTVTFGDEGGRTRLTSRMLFPTAAQRNGAAAYGAVELGNQTMAKLAEYLKTM